MHRLMWGGGILLIGIVAIAARMVHLQVFRAEALQAEAANQQYQEVQPFVPRRNIVDRQSIPEQQAEILAVDRPVYTLWAYPAAYNETTTAASLAKQLAPILEQPVDRLRERLDVSHPVRIARRLPEGLADRLKPYLGAIWLAEERQRVYPQSEDAAGIVGYVDLDHKGQAGVEYTWQDTLERTSQQVPLRRDGQGHLLAATIPPGVLEADNTVLQLTLDMRIQRKAREAVQRFRARHNAKRATAIVMNPKTGEILAMANDPTYNPNRYYDNYDIDLFRNWAVADLYEPGSTFKTITVALALEAGVVAPDAVIQDEGQIVVGDRVIQNIDYEDGGAPGQLGLSELLQRSSNVGMVRLVEMLGRERFHDELQKLGMGKVGGIDLPFEPTSRLKDRWQFMNIPIEAATTAIGQGIAMTPLQLLQMHAPIANGGHLVTPHVIRGVANGQTGDLLWQPEYSLGERVFSENTTHVVRQMMRDVVDHGTGNLASISGYEIGGKTGTAEIPSPDGAGYLSDEFSITSFIGYYPARDPDYILLAVVDEPEGPNAYGGTIAAPLARHILQGIISLDFAQPTTASSDRQ